MVNMGGDGGFMEDMDEFGELSALGFKGFGEEGRLWRGRERDWVKMIFGKVPFQIFKLPVTCR